MDDDGLPRALPSEKLVLLVDDDESLLDLMEHVVKLEGFRTERAEDGPEALRKAQALNPDIIVLDMMLPGLGGYEVLRQLQAAGCGDIPIIIVTGRQMDSQGVELIRQESNVKEFMEKPVRPAVVAATLHRLLNTQPTRSPRRELGT
jgi:CheY-like chemotaxis protein